MRFTICCLVLLVVVGGAFSLADIGRAEPIPEVQKEPLYKFRNKKSQYFYKPGPTLPAGLSGGPWVNEGVVCFVARDWAPGLKPIYTLSKSNDYGVFYSYTVQSGTPDFIGAAGGVQNSGPAFYVANTQLPGTVPLRGFSIRAAFTPDAQFVSGSGTYLFTTDPDAQPPSANWEKRGTLGYVWTSEAPPSETLPDLTIVKTNVKDSGIEAVIRNQGKTAVSSKPGVSAVLTVIDSRGKPVHFSGARQLGGMSPSMQIPVFFDTGALDLSRKQYQVVVDAGGLVAESNENNNSTGFVEIPGPKLKINPLPPGYVMPPSFNLTTIQPSPTASQPRRTIYKFDIWNWDKKFKPEAFQSMENILPPSPCGGGKTNARLVARLMVIRNSPPIPLGCKPLNTQADLRTLEFALSAPLGDADKVEIALVDTAMDAKYVSAPYPVGLFGVKNFLFNAGCKILGNESNYFCTSDQGMAACEKLRANGKPINCRRAGQ